MTGCAETAGSNTQTQPAGVVLTLPFPPSTNSYWRHPTKGRLAGRHLISEAGRKYRALVKEAAWNAPAMTGKVAIHIEAHVPDRRRRDLDNMLKATLDALVHAAVIEDDSDVDDLRIVRGPVTPGGHIVVRINQAGGAQ